MGFTFGGKERLKSKKIIDKIFSEGKTVTSYPLRLIYLKTEFTEGPQFKAGISVGKRNFKKAVDRNRIKRIIREAYRLNKCDNFNNISGSFALMILYIGKDGTEFEPINQQMKKLLKKFSLKISET